VSFFLLDLPGGLGIGVLLEKTDLLICRHRRVHDGVGKPDLAGDGREVQCFFLSV
jgi:hypothetical protein